MRHRLLIAMVRRAAVVALVAGSPVVLAQTADASAGAGTPPAGLPPTADFNGDGHPDIAAAAPGGTIAGQAEAGYVSIVYGAVGGPATSRHQVISQDSPGVPGDVVSRARFGSRVVARDLDGDGFTDLAVRQIVEDYTSSTVVVWGSADGLTGGTELAASTGANGDDLVGGDFNGDGHADLIADNATAEEWGDLRVLYGPFSRSGTPASATDLATNRTFTPDDLVSGDLTGDGKDDLVSLHSFEEMSESTQVWIGTDTGFTRSPNLVAGADAATIGDVDGDGHADLVIRKVPKGIVEELPYDEGTVQVIYGTASGPGTRTQLIDQDTAGVPGTGEDGDQFGDALSAGDVDNDGYADIAVGVPYEDLTPGGKDAGAVVLLKGAAKGLSGTGAQAWNQNTPAVAGVAEAGDRFGAAVRFADFDGDGRSDLLTGAPGEDGTYTDTGAVWMLRGGEGGLITGGQVSYGPGLVEAPEAGALLSDDFAS